MSCGTDLEKYLNRRLHRSSTVTLLRRKTVVLTDGESFIITPPTWPLVQKNGISLAVESISRPNTARPTVQSLMRVFGRSTNRSERRWIRLRRTSPDLDGE